MKKLKKISILVLVMSMFIINLSPVFASSYKLNIEKESADTKYLDNDQGYISKKIINSDLEKGEVTVELTVSNSKQSSNDETLGDPEIMIVLDNSGSMASNIDATGLTRKQTVINATKSLVDSLYADNENLKVGLVNFSAAAFLSNAYSAKVLQYPTSDKNALLNSLQQYENSLAEGNTDIAAGIQKANQSFSSSASQKVIIVITDGLPTAYLGSWYAYNYIASSDDKKITNNMTVEEYATAIITETGNYISTTAASTELITVLTGISEEENYNDVLNVFGTPSNPKADKYYNVTDTNLSKTITEDVLNDVKDYIQTNMKNVKITDYFPSDIKDNFEFSYVTKPTNGTITEKISDDNTITYTLNELKANESVKIAYKLKLRDNASTKILDKVINTNEKVVLNYTDNTSTEKEVILTSSPSIKLVKVEEPKKEETPKVEEEPKEEEKPVVEENKNVEEVVDNPPTGLYVSTFVLGILMVVSVIFIGLRRKNYFNKI